MASLPARSDQKRADSQLRCHQPHQTPREGFFQRLAGEVVFFRRMQRHHPTGMVDGPGVVATAGSDGSADTTGGKIGGQRNGSATVPALRLHESAPVTDAMRADRGLSAGATDGALPASSLAAVVPRSPTGPLTESGCPHPR